MARPLHPCLYCGTDTSSAVRVCRTCQRPTSGHRSLKAADILTEGDWIVIRGVKRWVPWDPAEQRKLIDGDDELSCHRRLEACVREAEEVAARDRRESA